MSTHVTAFQQLHCPWRQRSTQIAPIWIGQFEEIASELIESALRRDQAWYKKVYLQELKIVASLLGFTIPMNYEAEKLSYSEGDAIQTEDAEACPIIPFSSGKFSETVMFPSARLRINFSYETLVTLNAIIHVPSTNVFPTGQAAGPLGTLKIYGYHMIHIKVYRANNASLIRDGIVRLMNHSPFYSLPHETYCRCMLQLQRSFMLELEMAKKAKAEEEEGKEHRAEVVMLDWNY
ncbi:hypothetical protein BDZ91DRAFT_759379 [Kalaharituber pfeilii]|nr:hypothetical protein BDZ91DRAFT_759379 [Kalaharituber pfeilii]